MPERVARVASPSGARGAVGRVEDPGVRMWTRGPAVVTVAKRARAIMQGPLVSEWRRLAVAAWILTADATLLPALS